MRRTPSIAAAVSAAALTFAPAANAASPAQVLAAAAPVADAPRRLIADASVPRAISRAVLADAAPLAAPGVGSRVSPPVERGATPVADGDPVELAGAGEAQALLADAPAASARPPAATLPHTGAEPWLTLLAGAGMAMAGAGLRLRLRTRPPARP